MEPVVYHIGLHKTGTTWLQSQYFDQHPHIESLSSYLTPWDDEFLAELIGSSDRRFDPRACREVLAGQMSGTPNRVTVVSSERLSGHPVSGGYDSCRIAKRIKAVSPDAKVIMVIRNQLPMLRSVYKQLVAEGYPGSLRDLLTAESWKTARFDPDFYRYDLLIQYYQKLFSPQHVLVLSYEEMRSDKTTFLNRICTFLGIDYFDPPEAEKIVNVSLPDRGLPLVRWLNHFRRTELNPVPVATLPSSLRNKLIGLCRRLSGPGTSVGGNYLRQFVAENYGKSNARTSALCGVQLQPNESRDT